MNEIVHKRVSGRDRLGNVGVGFPCLNTSDCPSKGMKPLAQLAREEDSREGREGDDGTEGHRFAASHSLYRTDFT